MAPEVPCPAALRLPGLGYRTLRGGSRRPDKRSAIRHKGGYGPGDVLPAALRLPGLGYMGLRGAGDNVIGMQLY
ncbi:hypothetical protein A9F11_29345 [Klebsiella pneumoniae]|nr:hypothetical protein A9F11_29345 [Klebsiella pneumoniae]